MSIFPKRTLPGSTVTIHWNFNTSHLKDVAVCPYVRIGVIDPLGRTTMLTERHYLALPAIQPTHLESEKPLLYLNKNLPLLVIADYLSGAHKREVLVNILQGIQSGRHYYFTYNVPEDAPLGKYKLISEVYSRGELRLSKTAADDFFYVEKVSVLPKGINQGVYHAEIVNHSPENVPVKILDYRLGGTINTESVQVFELKGFERTTVKVNHAHSYLTYNEERAGLPLCSSANDPACIRNQQILPLDKGNGHEIFLLHRDRETTHKLTRPESEIWQLADGVRRRSEIVGNGRSKAYEAMKKAGLILEIQYGT
ncbi:hypothetical protein LAG90_17595 [Marinilongibacter aquaticus]|uniref:hypothetical protein n=1 Tax=Marinilongibacter aquaticus TaxID=2975157 RepID=UPI0021BD409E|nr:hypothetical protein [Marinilongibacter aquaticus]UBM58616.1 hypothetical protein LAG90_17595 [Marinilongibacter aquaticus]